MLLQYIQSDIPLKLLYFVFTSGMGNQTLGEEYTGIVQANLEQRRVPTLTVCLAREIHYDKLSDNFIKFWLFLLIRWEY